MARSRKPTLSHPSLRKMSTKNATVNIAKRIAGSRRKSSFCAVENMFAAWEAWRRENGVYPDMFEEGKMSDSRFYSNAVKMINSETEK